MVMSRGKNAGRSHNMKINNSSFESVKEFKYLETNLTNQNSTQNEIKSRWKSGNAWLLFDTESSVFQFAIQKHIE